MYSEDLMTGPPPGASAPHEIIPERGTITREQDGAPGNVNTVLDYPLNARCSACKRRIRLRYLFPAEEWVHVVPQPRGLRRVCRCGRIEHDYFGRCLPPSSTGLRSALARGRSAARRIKAAVRKPK
jgi:hypothetical protein